MPKFREAYESFVACNELDEKNVHNLVRLCGYAPLDSQQLSVPQSPEDLEKLCQGLEKKYTKEDLLGELQRLFDGDYCSEEELRVILRNGDKISEEECDLFFRQVPAEGGTISLESLVEWLMAR